MTEKDRAEPGTARSHLKGIKNGHTKLIKSKSRIIMNDGAFTRATLTILGVILFSATFCSPDREIEVQMRRTFFPSGVIQYDGGYSSAGYTGKGNLFFPNGRIRYRGEFKAGQFHGQGKLFNRQGILAYEGAFINGKRAGFGNEYYPNGKVKYIGEWKSDAYNGLGAHFCRDGTYGYIGHWEDDQRHGYGWAFARETLFYKGLYKNDVPVARGGVRFVPECNDPDTD
ncbi:MAG: hypothetical protein CMF59_16905 [Leptospiraceae bacterium]|nr:hypothetical protein [Leptospiraceae bacterium]